MDPLYSALHGPTATNSYCVCVDVPNPQTKHSKQRNYTAKHQLKNTSSLYLYHGKRFCVGRENEDDSDASLFHSTKDASLGMYDHQRIFQVWETVYGIEQQLKQTMGTLFDEIKKYPVFKLYLKNNKEHSS